MRTVVLVKVFQKGMPALVHFAYLYDVLSETWLTVHSLDISVKYKVNKDLRIFALFKKKRG